MIAVHVEGGSVRDRPDIVQDDETPLIAEQLGQPSLALLDILEGFSLVAYRACQLSLPGQEVRRLSER